MKASQKEQCASCFPDFTLGIPYSVIAGRTEPYMHITVEVLLFMYTLDLFQSGHPQLHVGAHAAVQNVRVQVPQGLVAQPNLTQHTVKHRVTAMQDYNHHHQ